MFGKIRVVGIDKDAWFVASDVLDILGYKNGLADVEKHIINAEETIRWITTKHGTQELAVIDEFVLFRLINSSKSESANKFRHFVTSEILPYVYRYMYDSESKGSIAGVLHKVKSKAVSTFNKLRAYWEETK